MEELRNKACELKLYSNSHLEELLLTGAPCSMSQLFTFRSGQVAGAAIQLTDRDLQVAEQLNRVLPQLFVPVHAVFGLADHDHFLLLELVDAVDAALLNAVGAFSLRKQGE